MPAKTSPDGDLIAKLHAIATSIAMVIGVAIALLRLWREVVE